MGASYFYPGCLSALAAVLFITRAAPAAAADGGRVLGVKHYQKVLPGPGGPGGATTSKTIGWRKIHGWQNSVVGKDRNLAHWSWMDMQEMEKSYMHVAPGQIVSRGGVPRPSHYIKPKHVPTVARSSCHPPVMTANSTPGGHYIKPKHVDAVPPPVAKNDTYIRWYAPKTNVQLAAPKTALQLAAPRTKATLASKNTSIQLAAPKTNIQLAAPKTAIQLAAPQTSATLASKDTHATLKPAEDLAGDPSLNTGADSFSDPDAYEHNVYGLARHVQAGGGSSAGVALHGKVLSHHGRAK